MIVDAAPVGPFGGFPYRFCGFMAKAQESQTTALVEWLAVLDAR